MIPVSELPAPGPLPGRAGTSAIWVRGFTGAVTRSLFFIFVSFAMAAPALSQYQTSTILGLVHVNGTPIPNAQIEWTQDGQLQTLLTDSFGRFSFFFLSPGLHRFHFTHPSTLEAGVYDALIGVNSTLTLDVDLRYVEGETGTDTWHVLEQASKAPAVGQPERLVTARQMESLPNAEHLESFLNQTEVSVATDIYDIGGLDSYRQFLVGVHGSSVSQNQGVLNGLSINNPSGMEMLVYPDMAAMESIIYTVGESLTNHLGAGAHLDVIPKTGDRELHGQAQMFFQAGALQNTNSSARNRSFFITDSDERWRHFVNSSFQIGGPVGTKPWTYFGAISARDIEKWIRNQPEPVSADLGQGTFSISGRLSSKDRIGIYTAAQRRRNPQADASPQVTRESSIDEKQTYHAIQASWTRSLSSRSLLDVRIGVAWSDLMSGFQPGANGQSSEDIFAAYAVYAVLPDPKTEAPLLGLLNNTRRGPAPLAVSFNVGSSQSSIAYSTVRDGFWASHHRFSTGASYRRSSLEQRTEAVDGVTLLFFQGSPNSVRMLNTPARTLDQIGQLELYGSDSMSFGRLSLTAGLSLDLPHGQSSLQSGQSINKRGWADVGERAGVAYQLMDRYPLVLRAGAARIYDQPVASGWTAANPEGPGVKVYSWSDANGDRQFQDGENSQLLKVYGAPYTRMDPNLKNPETTEVTVGFSQKLMGGLTYRMSGFRRVTHNLMSLVNEGVPFTSYTPIRVLDPGPDGAAPSGDDQVITVFNQNAETLGQDRYLLTNPQGFSGHSEGWEMKLFFSSRKIQSELSTMQYRAVAATSPGFSALENDTQGLLGVFDDPNKAILARGSTYFDRGIIARFQTTADFRWNIRGSIIGSYQDGLPYGRVLPITGLNQGIIGVLTTQRGPGDKGTSGGPRGTHYENIDVRLLKVFPLGKRKLVASLDIFNLANRALPAVQATVTGPTQYWRVPLKFQTPRSLQPGIRYTW
jgi:hypothetical protein